MEIESIAKNIKDQLRVFELRAKLELPADTDKDAIEQAALADENVIKFTSNKPPKKVIYVPKKLVNIVI